MKKSNQYKRNAIVYLIINVINIVIVLSKDDVTLMNIYLLSFLILIGCINLWLSYVEYKQNEMVYYGYPEKINTVIKIAELITLVVVVVPMINNLKLMFCIISSILLVGALYKIKRSEKKLRVNESS